MADSSEPNLIQTVLNFNSRGTNTGGSNPPYFIRQSQRSANILPLKPTRESDHSDDSSTDEMEEVHETQTNIGPANGSVSDSTSNLERVIRRRELRRIAKETATLLPNVLATAPHAPPKGYLYSFPNPPRLHHKYCPSFPKTVIRVLDADSLDTAIGLAQCSQYVTVRDKRPVCVLNMANAHNAGGGWKNGAIAQEEALCYRSSLSFTLKLRYYPIPELGAIYSPTVLVIRSSMKNGHKLLSLDEPEKLPVVSVISAAALCLPNIVEQKTQFGPNTPAAAKRDIFSDPEDRDITKEKIRMVLRTAVCNGHRRLVLGALGCGAFMNPREEVADCFGEVFGEQEFSGGWWESVIFAVMDDLGEGMDGDGNFGVFYRRLNGMKV